MLNSIKKGKHECSNLSLKAIKLRIFDLLKSYSTDETNNSSNNLVFIIYLINMHPTARELTNIYIIYEGGRNSQLCNYCYNKNSNKAASASEKK